MSWTMLIRLPTSALSRLLLPTFGRPTIAMTGRRFMEQHRYRKTATGAMKPTMPSIPPSPLCPFAPQSLPRYFANFFTLLQTFYQPPYIRCRHLDRRARRISNRDVPAAAKSRLKREVVLDFAAVSTWPSSTMGDLTTGARLWPPFTIFCKPRENHSTRLTPTPPSWRQPGS